ncbi:MAG: PorP/SprF family type IX secretion system membrane protein [Bacteroidales bacterium]
MIKRILLILTICLIGFSGKITAQDAHFSQFFANPLYLNPAFTGSDRCPRVNLSYRNQWPALGQTYVTYSLSYDQHVNVLKGGAGLLLMNDVQGDGTITATTLAGMYSYTLPVTRRFAIAGGFQAAFIIKTIEWNFIFPDMIHPLYGPIYATNEDASIVDDTKNYFDFSAGFVGFTENTFFGFAVHHLTEPAESFLRGSDAVLPRKFTVHFGTDIPINAKDFRRGELSIAPQLLFHQQGDFQQFNWGVYVNRKSIVAGFWLRQNFNFHYDSFIMLVGFRQDQIKVGYSYDLTVSKLKNSTLGAHEVTFGFTFNCNPPKSKYRTISCPSF